MLTHTAPRRAGPAFRFDMRNSPGKSSISRSRTTRIRLVLLYIVFGLLWIIFSDRLVAWLVDERATMDTIQTAKGWFFVAFTGAMLYLLTHNLSIRGEDVSDNSRGHRPMRFLHRHSTHVAMTVLITGVCVSILAWITIRQRDAKQSKDEFQLLAEERIGAIRHEARSTIEFVDFLAAFFQSSTEVTRDEFEAFARKILRARPYFWRAHWSVMVKHQDLDALVKQARAEGIQDFSVRERTLQQTVVPVQRRDEHAVVWFEVSTRAADSPLGLDLLASPARRDSLVASRDSGNASLTAPTTLFADVQGQHAVSLFKAVYARTNTGDIPQTPEARRSRVTGYVGVGFRIPDFIEESLRNLRDSHMELSVFDAEFPAERLAVHAPESSDLPPMSAAQIRAASPHVVEKEIDIGGRKWLVLCVPAAETFSASLSLASLSIPLGGMLGSLLLSMYIASLGSLASSERVAAKNALALAERSHLLEVSEARLRMALSCGHLGVWNWDFKADVVSSDDYHGEIWGRRPGDPPIGTDFYRERMDPLEYDRTMARLQVAVDNHTDYTDVVRILLPDGTRRWGEIRGPCQYAADGSPLVMIGVLADITNRKVAELEIQKLNEKLEERVQLRTRELERVNHELEAFTYSVSHDLRAPLRAIDGFSRILLAEGEPKTDSEVRRMLGIIRTNTIRMSSLIDDLLVFSRLGRSQVKRLQVDMNALVQDVIQTVIAPEEVRRVRFEIGSLSPCSGDPTMLKQVWINLISNAVKFTRDTPHPHIRISSIASNEIPTYRIEDNGIGFDMQYADKLFGVFQRLHRWDEFEGTGVGLAIVKRVIERHGGVIHAFAEIEKGARFEFTVPGAADE